LTSVPARRQPARRSQGEKNPRRPVRLGIRTPASEGAFSQPLSDKTVFHTFEKCSSSSGGLQIAKTTKKKEREAGIHPDRRDICREDESARKEERQGEAQNTAIHNKTLDRGRKIRPIPGRCKHRIQHNLDRPTRQQRENGTCKSHLLLSFSHRIFAVIAQQENRV